MFPFQTENGLHCAIEWAPIFNSRNGEYNYVVSFRIALPLPPEDGAENRVRVCSVIHAQLYGFLYVYQTFFELTDGDILRIDNV